MCKLTLLIAILMIGIAFAGCQQAGLTEAEVRSIVRQEVANQLASGQLKGIVGQEVTNVGQAIVSEFKRQNIGLESRITKLEWKLGQVEDVDVIKQQLQQKINNLEGQVNELEEQLWGVSVKPVSVKTVEGQLGNIEKRLESVEKRTKEGQ